MKNKFIILAVIAAIVSMVFLPPGRKPVRVYSVGNAVGSDNIAVKVFQAPNGDVCVLWQNGRITDNTTQGYSIGPTDYVNSAYADHAPPPYAVPPNPDLNNMQTMQFGSANEAADVYVDQIQGALIAYVLFKDGHVAVPNSPFNNKIRQVLARAVGPVGANASDLLALLPGGVCPAGSMSVEWYQGNIETGNPVSDIVIYPITDPVWSNAPTLALGGKTRYAWSEGEPEGLECVARTPSSVTP